MRDRERAGLARSLGEVGRRLEAAEEVRLLEEDGRRVLGGFGEALGVGRAAVCGTSTTSRPNPGAYVFTTWRTCGLSVSASTTFVRSGTACFATKTASAATVHPSYPDAFDTSIPVSSQTTVWYSKIAWRTPWLISGWYGVYAVRNSPRESTTSTTDGT